MINLRKKIRTALKEESLIKYVIMGALIFIGVCILELFVFNYRHWQFLGSEPQPLSYTAMSDQLAVADTNAFEVKYEDESLPYIEVSGLDTPIKNIMLDFTFPLEGAYAVKKIEYHYEIFDEGNVYGYSIPSRTFMHLVPQSHFNYLNPYGNVHTFRIYFENLEVGDIVRVEFLVLNSQVPMMFSKKRVLALTFFLFLMFLLRPHSFLYDIKISEKRNTIKGKIKICSIIVMLMFEIIFSHWAVNLNTAFQNPEADFEKQFMYMAEALANGQTHLLMEVPEEVKNCPDPYDYNLRLHYLKEGQEEQLWDVAYYGGHYFVYFGVAPIILYYLPYYLITGTHIHTVNVVFINLVFAILGIATLMYELSKRLYRDLPLSVYLMFTYMFTFGCGLIFLIMKGDFYAVPIAMAVALLAWGMFFWIHSIGEDRINPLMIAFGSLLLALEAATRPQFLLASFMAFFIFWKSVFKDRKLFSKKSVGATAGFIAPYVVVAALVMFYNFDRFGNVFDFGANYNLTINNMPYRGFHLDRLLHATIGYLFYPCTVSNRFPYFDISTYNSGYMGITADEPLFGGLIYNNIILLISLLGFKFRKYIKNKTLYIYILLAPVIVLSVAFVDANMAGVLTRYYNDFAWYLFVSTFMILCAVLSYGADNGDTRTLNMIYHAVFICFIITFVRIFLDLFAGDAYPQNNMMLIWQNVEHLVEFWR